MSGKLIKYELKTDLKGMLIIWAAAFALALISGISYHANRLAGILVYVFSTALSVLIIILMILVVILNAVIRFYKEMLTTEGYLTHMLPVKPWQHIVSRVLTTFIWLILSAAVVFVSIGVMQLLSGNNIGAFAQDLVQGLNLQSAQANAGNIVMYCVYMLSYAAAFVMAIYTAILIGGCANRRKGLFVFLALIGIFAADWILTSILGFGSTVSLVDADGTFLGYITVATWKETIYQIILMLIFFFSSRDLLAKKVNLTL